MSNKAAQKSRAVLTLSVLRRQQLTPHMVRLVFGGDELAQFTDKDFTDKYVKLILPPPGVSYPEPFSLDDIQRSYPSEQWPVRRTYTVRKFDLDLGELTIDFVCHGDKGVGGPWAATARPGDPVRMVGPGGAYRPSPEADWHLLVGDESAIPAIAAALEEMPDDVPVTVIMQVANRDEVQTLTGCPGATFIWLLRNEAKSINPRQELIDAVTQFEFPSGRGQFFVHGEAETVMKGIRPYLVKERGIPTKQLSISGYWRVGDTDEAFRAWKAQENTTAVNGSNIG